MKENGGETQRPPRNVGNNYRDFIRMMRFLSGWTQDELAEQLGVRQQSIHRWEHLKPGLMPQRRNRERIAEFFGLSKEEHLQLSGFGNLETTPPESTDPRERMLGSFATRLANGPPMNEVEAALLRELLGLQQAPDES